MKKNLWSEQRPANRDLAYPQSVRWLQWLAGRLAEERCQRRDELLDWVRALVEHGARLEFAGARLPCTERLRWLGQRLLLIPAPPPCAAWSVALVSSHLGKHPDRQPAWFGLLRRACRQAKAENHILVTAADTAAAPYVLRAAEQFRVPIQYYVEPPLQKTSFGHWLQQVRRSLSDSTAYCPLFLSPLLDASPVVPAAASDLAAFPLRDRALVALSDRLLVLHVRPRGRTEQLVHARLGSSGWPPASVFVVVDGQLVPHRLSATWMDQGAVGWYVSGSENGEDPWNVLEQGKRSGAVQVVRNVRSWPYLTHCTCSRAGPWPGQSTEEYLDELVWGAPAADRSSFAALRRILHQRQILASGAAIRGSTPVVSFTAVPLAELSRLHVFRPQRLRWDFEPYGICIRKPWLLDRGCQPVIYGDDTDWEGIEERQRPFFQRRSGRSGQDWTVEQEWRHVGDVLLEELPQDAGFIFVPSEREARRLQPESRWPVLAAGQR